MKRITLILLIAQIAAIAYFAINVTEHPRAYTIAIIIATIGAWLTYHEIKNQK